MRDYNVFMRARESCRLSIDWNFYAQMRERMMGLSLVCLLSLLNPVCVYALFILLRRVYCNV